MANTLKEEEAVNATQPPAANASDKRMVREYTSAGASSEPMGGAVRQERIRLDTAFTAHTGPGLLPLPRDDAWRVDRRGP